MSDYEKEAYASHPPPENAYLINAVRVEKPPTIHSDNGGRPQTPELHSVRAMHMRFAYLRNNSRSKTLA